MRTWHSICLSLFAILLAVFNVIPFGTVAWGQSVSVPTTTLRISAPVSAPHVPESWLEVATPVGTTIGADALEVQRVSSWLETQAPLLSRQLGVPMGGKIYVVITSTARDFRVLQPGPVPAWADATAWPRLGWIYLRSPSLRAGDSAPLEQVFKHELVHILLGRAFQPRTVPSWLQEGVAQTLSGEVTLDLPQRLAREMAWTGDRPSLTMLSGSFSHDPRRASLAYLMSADFIRFLQLHEGPDIIPRLVAASVTGDGIEGAIQQVTGKPLSSLEMLWLARLPSPLTAWFSSTALVDLGWMLMALVAGIAGILRWRVWRNRRAALRRELQTLRQAAKHIAQCREAAVRANHDDMAARLVD